MFSVFQKNTGYSAQRVPEFKMLLREKFRVKECLVNICLIFFFISNLIHYSFRLRTISAILLSSACFRPRMPIIRRSKLYMQPVVLSPLPMSLSCGR